MKRCHSGTMQVLCRSDVYVAGVLTSLALCWRIGRDERVVAFAARIVRDNPVLRIDVDALRDVDGYEEFCGGCLS